jgi:hypothetical protein
MIETDPQTVFMMQHTLQASGEASLAGCRWAAAQAAAWRAPPVTEWQALPLLPSALRRHRSLSEVQTSYIRCNKQDDAPLAVVMTLEAHYVMSVTRVTRVCIRTSVETGLSNTECVWRFVKIHSSCCGLGNVRGIAAVPCCCIDQGKGCPDT